jgi:hypothetical protein
MHDAVRDNDQAKLHRLLQEGHDINALDFQGTPLIVACMESNLPMVAYLLNRGADPTIGNADGFASFSPLHGAAWSGCIRCAKLLLERGVRTDQRNNDDLTPTQYARKYERFAFAAFLEDYGKQLAISAKRTVAKAPVISPVAPAPPSPPPSTPHSPAEPPRRAKGEVVAVFDLEDVRKSLADGDADQLTEYFAVQLSTAGYKVVPRSQLKERLTAAKEASYQACYEESCQIDLGKAVAAQKSVAVKLLKVGTSCALTATLYDLRSETAELAASVDTRCGQEELFAGLRSLAQKLVPAG